MVSDDNKNGVLTTMNDRDDDDDRQDDAAPTRSCECGRPMLWDGHAWVCFDCGMVTHG